MQKHGNLLLSCAVVNWMFYFVPILCDQERRVEDGRCVATPAIKGPVKGVLRIIVQDIRCV